MGRGWYRCILCNLLNVLYVYVVFEHENTEAVMGTHKKVQKQLWTRESHPSLNAHRKSLDVQDSK